MCKCAIAYVFPDVMSTYNDNSNNVLFNTRMCVHTNAVMICFQSREGRFAIQNFTSFPLGSAYIRFSW